MDTLNPRTVTDAFGIPLTFTPAYAESLFFRMFSPEYLPRSQEGGEGDLVRLARQEYNEASWLYCHDDSTWYNILWSVIEQKGNPSRHVDYSFDYSQVGKRFSDYHTHPRSDIAGSAESYRQMKAKPRIKLKGRLLGDYIRRAAEVLTALPSPDDMVAQVKKLKLIKGAAVDFRIASAYGITVVDYDAPRKGIKADYQEHLSSLLVGELPRIFEAHVGKGGPEPEKLIEHGVSFLSARLAGVRLSFRAVK